ncbi:choice-of-anchor A family protein [bacterium]|nr:MAG: choice-of-anchor A family protein [bacterium]
MTIRTLLTLLPLALPVLASAQTFGAASSYSVFTAGDYTHNAYSNVGGKVAVGGNYRSEGANIGTALNGATQDALVVKGKADFKYGTIGGNAVSGDSGSYFNWSPVFRNGGSARQGTSLDFGSVATDLQNRSAYWGGLAANSTVSDWYGTLTLTGSSSSLNVFNLDASKLGGYYSYNLNVPAGSTVLFNVTGASGSFAYPSLNNFDSSKTLWNFTNATNLSVNGLKGSVLAPYAALSATNSGQTIDGQVFASSMVGGINIGSSTFSGDLAYSPQAVPEPASMVAFGIGGLALFRRRRNARK